MAIGVAAWLATGDAVRFLAVMVVATPCPLLIAIPVAVIGSISLAAKRAIIVRDPAVLETVSTCRTIIFDKTGTLTYGQPELIEQNVAAGCERGGGAVAGGQPGAVFEASAGRGDCARRARDRGRCSTRCRRSASRRGRGCAARSPGARCGSPAASNWRRSSRTWPSELPPPAGGLECVILVDGRYAATYRFRDRPRREGRPFIRHLAPRHHIDRVMLVSGDRPAEVKYLAELVGIPEVLGGKSPEEKLEIVRAETARANTIYVGDGINDAPALVAATVGIAFGQNSDVTTEAADVVVMDSSLAKVDEFLHISGGCGGSRCESAVGGMAASIVGMLFAAAGYLPPVAGAIVQEVIDVVVVVNALRVAIRPRELTDF